MAGIGCSTCGLSWRGRGGRHVGCDMHAKKPRSRLGAWNSKSRSSSEMRLVVDHALLRPCSLCCVDSRNVLRLVGSQGWLKLSKHGSCGIVKTVSSSTEICTCAHHANIVQGSPTSHTLFSGSCCRVFLKFSFAKCLGFDPRFRTHVQCTISGCQVPCG